MGFLFVGAVHEEASPNGDSIIWFLEQVLPKIQAVLGTNVPVTIAGVNNSERIRRLAGRAVSITGRLADLTPLISGSGLHSTDPLLRRHPAQSPRSRVARPADCCNPFVGPSTGMAGWRSLSHRGRPRHIRHKMRSAAHGPGFMGQIEKCRAGSSANRMLSRLV